MRSIVITVAACLALIAGAMAVVVGPAAARGSAAPASRADATLAGLVHYLDGVHFDRTMSPASATVEIPLGTPVDGIRSGNILTLSIVPTGDSVANVTVTFAGRLPDVFGDVTGTATATIRATYVTSGVTGELTGGSVTGLHIVAAHASLGELFALKDVTLRWAAATGIWNLSGQGFYGQAPVGTLAGHIALDPETGEVTGGRIAMHNLSLAAVIDITSFSITYEPGTHAWSGAAVFAKDAGTARVELGFEPNGTVRSGIVETTGTAKLFEVIELRALRFGYDGAHKRWDMAITPYVPGAGGVTVALTAQDGAVLGARFALHDVYIANVIELGSVDFAFERTATHEAYAASASVVLPGGVGTRVHGGLSFVDGRFASGHLGASTINAALGTTGIYLQSVHLTLVASPHWRLTGAVGLTAGPEVNHRHLVGVEGEIGYGFPSDAYPSGDWLIQGITTIGGEVLGNGRIFIAAGHAVTFGLHLGAEPAIGVSYGPARITGGITGVISAGTFELAGSVDAYLDAVIYLVHLRAHAVANTHGMAACWPRGSGEDGFTWMWGRAPVVRVGDCTTTGF